MDSRANRASSATLNRAYSFLEIKEVDNDKGLITGIASTPTPDRLGDIVEPQGATFALPIPLLWQHDKGQPIGWVQEAKVTKAGIRIIAQVAKSVTPEIDRAWALIKAGLVRGLSIGFRALDTEDIPNSWSVVFKKWEWLELSAVTIPANAEASIQTVKEIDTEQRAALGTSRSVDHQPAPRHLPIVKAEEAKMNKPLSYAEKIAAFEVTRAEKSARMDELLNASPDETLDAASTEDYDTLKLEVKSLDEHIARLKEREEANKIAAVEVRGDNARVAAESRPALRVPASARFKLEKGITFARMVMAFAAARGNRTEAIDNAVRNFGDTPEVANALRIPLDVIERAAVDAGTTTHTTWAAPLVEYQILQNQFIELLRPMTIIGRMSGFRNVPFKIKVPRQTAGATVNWVGEAKVKPLSSLAFDSVTLDITKIAGIIPLSEELVRFSNPSAELLVRNDLAKAVVQFMDSEFIDPTKAATDVSPASITNGVTPIAATGTTAAAFRADVASLFATFLDANIDLSTGHWIMTQKQALQLSLMQQALGTKEFPDMTMMGGTLLGFPVIATQNVPATGGSPTDGYPIIFAVAGEIMLADDGGVSIDMSREASLQMDSAPDSPTTASTVMVSLWQHNMIAIKAERFINWKKARSTAVAYISFAKYAA